MNENYFNIYSNCILTKGKNMSLISDVQLGKIYHINNDTYKVLTFLAKKSIEECYKHYGKENKDTIDSYLVFFNSIDIGFIDITIFKELSKLSLHWEAYSKITNMIIEYSHMIDYSCLLSNLESNFNIDAIELRFYKNISLIDFSSLISLFDTTKIQSIEIILQYSFYEENHDILETLVKQYPRISKIYFSGSKEDEEIKIFDDSVKVIFLKKSITSCYSCGVVSPKNFRSNIQLFSESKNHNSCLNKKISIDSEGNIRNCPSMLQSFGNIKDTTLEDALNHKDFKKYWNLTKDKIEVCKDCEFRYICTDCRAYTERTHENEKGLDTSKPLKCGYNPYTGEWEEWSTNPLKQKAIKYYGMQELIKKN